MGTVYATTADLANLGLPSAVLTGMLPDMQTAALTAASGTVDSYLSSRFKLPLVSYGTDLKQTVCALAAWSLLSTRGFNPDSGADAAVRQRYDDAMRWLRDVADERATPAGVVDSSSTGSTIAPLVYSRPRRGW